MSSNVFRIAFAVVAAAPFALTACDMLKKGDGADAAVVVAPPVTAATAAPTTAADPAAAATPVAPLGGGVVTPTAPGVKPLATDAGKPTVVDAAVAADGGKAAPIPTPAFTIPTALPGFDAAAFKPPPGFPSTLPTFPPPPPPAKN